jgi:hypothetical protein
MSGETNYNHMRAAVELIHLLFCKKDHKRECFYYNSFELADWEDDPDCAKWISATQLIMQATKRDTDQLVVSLEKVLKVNLIFQKLDESEKRLFLAIADQADLTRLVLGGSHLFLDLTQSEISEENLP